LLRKPEGKKPPERPRRRCEKNIKIDLRERERERERGGTKDSLTPSLILRIVVV
jgi:hypothetical protein